MSRRLEEKQRRKAERLERERRRAASERRRRLLRRLGVRGATLAAVVAIAVPVLLFGGKETPAVAKGPFGTHYEGLEDRRLAAAVPTMMETMGSEAHSHPRLSVFADGKPVPVPANIGIDPARDGMDMAGLHTHDDSGVIHVEGMSEATLGQFFEIWGVPFSESRLGPYRAASEKNVRMWVDGERSPAFGELDLAEGQRIVVSFGTAEAPPTRG